MEKGIFLPGLEFSQLRQNPSIIISSVKNISCLFSFLLWVQPLLDSFGITLCHGVNDGQDEVTHHYNDQLLKHPGQPVFSLQEQMQNNQRETLHQFSRKMGIIHVKEKENLDLSLHIDIV